MNSSVDFSVDFCRGFFRGFFSSYFEIFDTKFFHFFFHGIFHTLFHGGFPRWNIETDSELSFLKTHLPTRNTPRPCFLLAPLPRRCHPQKLRDKSHVYCRPKSSQKLPAPNCIFFKKTAQGNHLCEILDLICATSLLARELNLSSPRQFSSPGQDQRAWSKGPGTRNKKR